MAGTRRLRHPRQVPDNTATSYGIPKKRLGEKWFFSIRFSELSHHQNHANKNDKGRLGAFPNRPGYTTVPGGLATAGER